ncbi:MAG: hypothetical protein M4579_000721 [Chaenotheca gracillima]|nr:MAG: hypothetical protein M4579_000721 [Chaenotheca gracillima]
MSASDSHPSLAHHGLDATYMQPSATMPPEYSEHALSGWLAGRHQSVPELPLDSNVCATASAYEQHADSNNESIGQLLDPADYVARYSGSPDDSLPLLRPLTPSLGQALSLRSPLDCLDGLLDPQQIGTPHSAALTSGTTVSSSLSRESSAPNSGVICRDLGMMRFSSNNQVPNEIPENVFVFDRMFPVMSSDESAHYVEKDLSHSVRGTGAFSDNLSRRSLPACDSQATLPSFSSTSDSADMSRSSSAASNMSAVSARSARHLRNSKRPIAPKSPKKEVTGSPTLPHDELQSSELRGDSLLLSGGKRAIPKTNYLRPKHERVYCKKCKFNRDGFVSHHELTRHEKREHSKKRNQFICVDVSADKSFLANCKPCKTGKRYNIDYNAAAHLRRTHFHPREHGKGKSKVEESRAGKSGGDDPPIEILRQWIREVEREPEDEDHVIGESEMSQAFSPMEEDTPEDRFHDLSPSTERFSNSQAFCNEINSCGPPSASEVSEPSQASVFADHEVFPSTSTSISSFSSFGSRVLPNNAFDEIAAQQHVQLTSQSFLESSQVGYFDFNPFYQGCSIDEQTFMEL